MGAAPVSEELRRLRAEKMRQQWQNPEFREKALRAGRGPKGARSAETRQKLSDAMMAKWDDPTYRGEMLDKVMGAMAEARTGEVTKETRQKLSDHARSQWTDPVMRATMSAAISGAKKGRAPSHRPPTSETTKRKIAEARKRELADPAKRAVRVEAARKRKPPPRHVPTVEERDVLSQKAKARWADPAMRAKYITARNALSLDAGWRAAQSAARKDLWANSEEFRTKAITALSRAGGSSLEDRLAVILDELGIQYDRQKVIGRCIADFCVIGRPLIIEADGEYWHSKPEVKRRDVRRDMWLRSQGYRVLRLPESVIGSDPRPTITAFLEANQSL